MAQNTSTAVATVSSAELATGTMFTERQISLIRDQIAPDATNEELMLFIQVASSRGLDPFRKHIYAVTRYDSNKKRNVTAHQVSIDGLRLIAQRSGRYEGQTMPQWCGLDGIWKDVWLADEPPAAAKVGVYLKGAREPLYAVALYKTFVQKKRDGTITSFWRDMPEHMLAKVCESQALRKAFPEEAGGLYTSEEMGRADNPDAIETTARIVDRSTGEISDKARAVGDGAYDGYDQQRYGPSPMPPPEAQSGQDRLNAWNTANAALHAWADEAGLTHDDLHNAAVALAKGQHSSLTDMSGTEVGWLQERLREAHDRDPAKLAQWLVSIDPKHPQAPAPPERPLTVEEAIEASLASATPAGDQLPGMDDPELDRNIDRIAEAARA